MGLRDYQDEVDHCTMMTKEITRREKQYKPINYYIELGKWLQKKREKKEKDN